MLKHYIKVAFRNLVKTKLHSFINIVGLSIGIACSILVILFVKDELTFDQFNSKSEQLYRVYYKSERRDGSLNSSTLTPLAMGRQLKENYPEIEGLASWGDTQLTVTSGDELFEEQFSLTHPDFFNMFDFDILEGSTKSIFSNPTDLVISERMATKYFGNESAIGKSLVVQLGESEKVFEIKAVIQNAPSNSSLQYEMIISEEIGKEIYPEDMFTSWHLVFAENYVMLSEGINLPDLESKFPALVQTQLGEDLDGRLFEVKLQPMTDIHLNTELPQGNAPVSDPKFTVILSAIAILVLIMASINFINLSLGRSIGRAREIGVKKVVGASKKQLIYQFLGEAMLVSVISLVTGVLLSKLALSTFNKLAGKQLLFDISMQNLLMFIGLALVIGLISGIYPAFILSGFQPVKVLKGGVVVGSGKNLLRKSMLSIQLILSVFLITSVVIMESQMSFMRNKHLGFDKEQLVVFPLNVTQNNGFASILVDGMDKGRRILNALEGKPGIAEATLTAHTFEEGGWMTVGYEDADQMLRQFHFNVVDPNYINTTHMKILSGRDFQVGNEADARRSIIVNQAFVKEFGLEDAVGKKIPHDRFDDHEIIGVVEDFNYSSLHGKIEPAVLAINPMAIFSGINNLNINNSFVPKLMIRMAGNEAPKTIETVRKVWDEVYSGDPFNYTFVDQTIDSQYEADINFEKVISSATLIATIIGALGLFGLVSLTMNAKMKEISIRKLLGANNSHVLYVLGRDFILLVVVASIVSIPLTMLFVNDWLKDFEFRISPSVLEFSIGGLIILVISIFSMSYQAIKVLTSKPVDQLKSE